MEEASIEQALLMSTLSKFPVVLDKTWVVWNSAILTKRMVLAVTTKLHSGPLPKHMVEILLKDVSVMVTEPEATCAGRSKSPSSC